MIDLSDSTIADSKLIKVLSTFTLQEWKLFKGHEGMTGRIKELYEYLDHCFPFSKKDGLSKHKIFDSVFGKTEFDDKKLRYLLTDMLNKAYSYLKIRSLESKERLGNTLLLEELARRGADKAYLSLFKSDDRPTDKDATGSAEDFYYLFRDHYTHLNHFVPRQPRGQSNIGETARYLDIYYLAVKLQLLCEIINVRNVMEVNYNSFLQQEIITALHNGAFKDVPVVSIYYHILMTLTGDEQEHHAGELENILHSSHSNFSRQELREMYQYLMNFCIRKINTGDTTYLSRLFNIYKTILPAKIIFDSEHLSQWDYKNIVVIGLRAGDSKWVGDFIETYKEYLPSAERENAYCYNMAYYHFNTGNHKKTLSLLQQVEFTDLYYQLDMRAILLKCYYETDEMETLFYHLAAFRIFLSRNKLVSDYQRTIYRNMIRYTGAIARAGTNIKKLKQIREEVENVRQVADLNWLRKKIEELI
jgi:hypothetical protein